MSISMLKTTSRVLFVRSLNTRSEVFKFVIPAADVLSPGQVHCTHSRKQDKQMKRLRLGKECVHATGETGYEWRRRRNGWGCGRKKLSQTEEERLNELLQMAAPSIVDGRHITVGGLKTLSIFVQISIQRVPLEVFFHHIFALPPTRGLLFSFSPLLPHSWYSNSSFSYLNYTFICYYPAAAWGSARLRLPAVEAAAERVLNRGEPSKCSKDHRTGAPSVTGLWGFRAGRFSRAEGTFHPSEGKALMQVQVRLRDCHHQETQQAFLMLTGHPVEG